MSTKHFLPALIASVLMATLLAQTTLSAPAVEAKSVDSSVTTLSVTVGLTLDSTLYAPATCTGNIYGPQIYWWGARLVFDGCAVNNLYFGRGTQILDLAITVIKKTASLLGGPVGKALSNITVQYFKQVIVPQLYQKSQQCGGLGAEWHVNWWNPFEVTKLNGC